MRPQLAAGHRPAPPRRRPSWPGTGSPAWCYPRSSFRQHTTAFCRASAVSARWVTERTSATPSTRQATVPRCTPRTARSHPRGRRRTPRRPCQRCNGHPHAHGGLTPTLLHASSKRVRRSAAVTRTAASRTNRASALGISTSAPSQLAYNSLRLHEEDEPRMRTGEAPQLPMRLPPHSRADTACRRRPAPISTGHRRAGPPGRWGGPAVMPALNSAMTTTADRERSPPSGHAHQGRLGHVLPDTTARQSSTRQNDGDAQEQPSLAETAAELRQLGCALERLRR